MESKERDHHHLVRHGAHVKDIPWKTLIVDMREKVEESSRRLLQKRHTTDVRLDKKLGMMRLALLHQMHAKLKQEVDTKFLIEIIELINRAEELLENYEQDVRDWLEFIELLEKKLEAEGKLEGDEELEEQGTRLKKAINRLKGKLEDR